MQNWPNKNIFNKVLDLQSGQHYAIYTIKCIASGFWSCFCSTIHGEKQSAVQDTLSPSFPKNSWKSSLCLLNFQSGCHILEDWNLTFFKRISRNFQSTELCASYQCLHLHGKCNLGIMKYTQRMTSECLEWAVFLSAAPALFCVDKDCCCQLSSVHFLLSVHVVLADV